MEQRLGRGAFGTVYRGTQIQLDRPVAIKFFSAQGLPILQDDCERFEREALLLARIDHPGIPYVLTTGHIDDAGTRVPYFVMQLVEGSGLDIIIRKHGKMRLRQACEVICHVLDALQAVHERKIIHRDVKPNNILVGDRRSWVVDFTLGASLRYEPGLTRSTQPRQGIGVPDYASPEQLSDAKSCDHRTDIYSCGIVLFEMLSGHTRIDRQQLRDQLRDEPPAFVEALQRAAALDRDKRYESAAAFRAALKPFISTDVQADPQLLALCINAKCAAAKRSPKGYFFAPRAEVTSKAFCDACGGRLVRRCHQCQAPLSTNARERVTKEGKSAPDAGSLFCAECGSLIFEYPICKKCRSLLKVSDMERNTETEGCAKCSFKPRKVAKQSESPEDDDVPF